METETKIGIGVVVVMLLIVVVPVTISAVGIHWNTGEGEHTGYVTAVQKQGVFFKTWRAYVKTETESSQEDTYCIVDPKVVKELQDAAKNKSLVTVSYFSWFAAGWANCQGEGDVISKIEPLTN